MDRLITLTTDFGLKDHYVGAMKGSILSVARGLEIVDISHLVGAGNIMEGAFIMSGACGFFPAGSIHVGVVDPGVGSGRRPILVEAGDYTFVGPDNGLLELAARALGIKRAIELTNTRLFRPLLSATFHGRDIFGPAAAHLAVGIDPLELGVEIGAIERLEIAGASVEGGAISGEVVYVDTYGNLITNITEADLEPFKAACEVCIAGVELRGLRRTYSDEAGGSALALIGSSGLLEVAVNAGSAAQTLKAGVGERVTVRRAGQVER